MVRYWDPETVLLNFNITIIIMVSHKFPADRSWFADQTLGNTVPLTHFKTFYHSRFFRYGNSFVGPQIESDIRVKHSSSSSSYLTPENNNKLIHPCCDVIIADSPLKINWTPPSLFIQFQTCRLTYIHSGFQPFSSSRNRRNNNDHMEKPKCSKWYCM